MAAGAVMCRPALIVHPRFFTVMTDRLLGGEHPCPGGDPTVHAARLDALLNMGVTTFLDLTERHRENRIALYDRRIRGAERHGLSVTYFNFPVPDAQTPQCRGQVAQVLDVVDAALENGETVYLHCRSGIGRTGTMLALHLIRHDYAPIDALRQLDAAWRRDARSRVWPRCPQTEGQRRYIMETVA